MYFSFKLPFRMPPKPENRTGEKRERKGTKIIQKKKPSGAKIQDYREICTEDTGSP